MARRKSHKVRKYRKRTPYGSCMSRAMKGRGCKKGVKGGRRACARRKMKHAVNKCKHLR